MRLKPMVGLVAGLSLFAAACGDDIPDEPAAAETSPAETSPAETSPAATTAQTSPAETSPAETSPPETSPPETSGAADETVADETYPTAIVSLSPTATEMLFAIGAGDQVLAVDNLSNHPDDAAGVMIADLSAFQPNIEAIAALEPDLVVTDGSNPDLLAQFDTLGIAHWAGPAATSFDDVYAQIEQLGAATGHVGEAAELVGQMQAEVEAVKAGLPELAEPLTYFHELDPTHYSVTSSTFIGAVYAEIGLINIADEAGIDSPYPQLSAEYILETDPDLIFLACTIYCGETAASVAERPGWGALTAVANGGVIEMNDDIASRWGPRIVEYLAVAGEAVAAAAALQSAA